MSAEHDAALAAFAVLPEAERAAMLATARDWQMMATADWRPCGEQETHAAFAVATACVAALYHEMPVPLSVLLDGEEAEHVVWALADLLAHVMRRFPDAEINHMLRAWGAHAAKNRG